MLMQVDWHACACKMAHAQNTPEGVERVYCPVRVSNIASDGLGNNNCNIKCLETRC